MNTTENPFLSLSKNSYFNIFGIWIVLTIVGLIGNTIVLHILLKPKFLIDQIFRYYIFTAILDNAIIIMMCLWYILILINWNKTILFCKIFKYWLYIFNNFHAWISVITSVDRLLCLKYPTKYIFNKAFKNQAKGIGTTFFLLVFINIPNYIYFGISNETKCEIEGNQYGFYNNLFNLLISNLLPVFIVIILMSVILNELRKKKNIPNKTDNNLINLKKEYRFFKILLTINSFFMIAYLPTSVINFIKSVFNMNDIKYHYWKQVNDSTDVLSMIQTSSNFFIYVTFDKSFQQKFLSTFGFFKINRQNLRQARRNRKVSPL
jgi:hypothetical protein